MTATASLLDQSLNPAATQLIDKIRNRTAVIGVIGLGYVGLPLLIEFHKAGFPVIGLDIDTSKIESLRAGKSYILHIPGENVAAMAASEKFSASSDMADANKCDALLLCVPTPLTHHREPDITYVTCTCESIAPAMRAGQIVILESTTYPGTTDEVMVPILEKGSGLKAGRDFFVAYSPEREDPSNKSFSTATIPKVVGAMTPQGLEAAKSLYDAVVVKTIPVSSTRVAEATKLMENIFRCVNIAMVNELKVVFQRMDIDIWEVIEAAKTKPFGFMPFYPGPGLGGHCIPIDPFYLTWKAREYETPTRFIELAGEINTEMPKYVVSQTMEALNEQGKALKGSRILLIGLAYKADVDDLRESPTFKLIELFEKRGAEVLFHDPHIPEIMMTREHAALAGRKSVPLDEAAKCDATVISTAHAAVDYAKLGKIAKVIVDTRNAMVGVTDATAAIHKA
ncbi:MAG: UDP-N-acetyl-D-glucosamine dehydrogenase [Candidatus Sumerlaeota bacterium]|nr:UDP-N-acetyl-D-glucosamine dehydrogenase [Candidatus Sumerlaeota bacterium]